MSPEASGDFQEPLPEERELLDHASDQYRRLASEPGMAFDTRSFDPLAAADRLRVVSGRLGAVCGCVSHINSRKMTPGDLICDAFFCGVAPWGGA